MGTIISAFAIGPAVQFAFKILTSSHIPTALRPVYVSLMVHIHTTAKMARSQKRDC